MKRIMVAVITVLVFAWSAVPVRPPYASDAPLPEPVVFGEGVISTGDYDLNSAFTPDGKTVYFTKSAQSGGSLVAGRLAVIVFSQFRKGKWQMPEVASFSGQYNDYDPFVTADGAKLFFTSDRPAPGKEKRDFDIWYVEKTVSGWSEPRNAGPPVNSVANEFYPSVARDGTLYFGSDRAGGAGGSDIYRARFVDGNYTGPENLGPSINTESYENDNYIAPDQSWLVFASTRPGGLGDNDLYISYNENGSWTKAKNLGAPINSAGREFCPMGSPDGKYFFFTSTRSIPVKDRSSRLNYRELRRLLDGPGHGFGTIYQVDMDAVHRAGRGQ
jgi:Tol biopolymer transport system component